MGTWQGDLCAEPGAIIGGRGRARLGQIIMASPRGSAPVGDYSALSGLDAN